MKKIKNFEDKKVRNNFAFFIGYLIMAVCFYIFSISIVKNVPSILELYEEIYFTFFVGAIFNLLECIANYVQYKQEFEYSYVKYSFASLYFVSILVEGYLIMHIGNKFHLVSLCVLTLSQFLLTSTFEE